MDACLSLHCVTLWFAVQSAHRLPPCSVGMLGAHSTVICSRYGRRNTPATGITTVALRYDEMPKNVAQEACTSQYATGPRPTVPIAFHPRHWRRLSPGAAAKAFAPGHLQRPACSSTPWHPSPGRPSLALGQRSNSTQESAAEGMVCDHSQGTATTHQDAPGQRGLRHTEYARARETRNPAAGAAPQLHCRAVDSHSGKGPACWVTC